MSIFHEISPWERLEDHMRQLVLDQRTMMDNFYTAAVVPSRLTRCFLRRMALIMPGKMSVRPSVFVSVTYRYYVERAKHIKLFTVW